MPIDHETLGAMRDLLDEQSAAADEKRSNGFREVYRKLDAHNVEVRDRHDLFALKTDAHFAQVAVNMTELGRRVDGHAEKFKAIAQDEAAEAAAREKWVGRALALTSSGIGVFGLTRLWDWWRS